VGADHRGDSGIGRPVAVRMAREGADIAIAYLDEHEDADETVRAVHKEGTGAITLARRYRRGGSLPELVDRRSRAWTAEHPGQQRRGAA
jgi:NAD(P)-dependent dehydrogenase (short-subunit alcohol dehydrogenase family)